MRVSVSFGKIPSLWFSQNILIVFYIEVLIQDTQTVGLWRLFAVDFDRDKVLECNGL